MNDRALIIAECCQNHNGKREILKRMISEAAQNGADYVKIQAIRSSELSFRERFEEGVIDASGKKQSIKRPYAPERERLRSLDLSLEDEAWFVEECWRQGVAPMTTVFTRTSLQEVKDLGFEAVKIASYDCASYPLIREAAQYWSRLFVSTGGASEAEIERTAQLLQGKDFDLLHCVIRYPTPKEALNMKRMLLLKRYAHRTGFSDHTKPADQGLFASKLALALGASVIERHYTVLDPAETKDGPVSINPSQLNELSKFAQKSRYERFQTLKQEFPEWEQAMGSGWMELTEEELLNKDYYQGRFVSRVGQREIANWEDVMF